MRKLLLILAVILSASGFATHAQTTAPPISTKENPTYCIIENVRQGWYVYAPEAGATPAETNDLNQNIEWIFLAATAENIPSSVTPVYIYSPSLKSYLLHGEEAGGHPATSQAEAEASTDAIWYLLYNSTTAYISVTSPTQTESGSLQYGNNALLCDNSHNLLKWNGTIDSGNQWKIYTEDQFLESFKNLSSDYNAPAIYPTSAVATAQTELSGFTPAGATLSDKINSINTKKEELISTLFQSVKASQYVTLQCNNNWYLGFNGSNPAPKQTLVGQDVWALIKDGTSFKLQNASSGQYISTQEYNSQYGVSDNSANALLFNIVSNGSTTENRVQVVDPTNSNNSLHMSGTTYVFCWSASADNSWWTIADVETPTSLNISGDSQTALGKTNQLTATATYADNSSAATPLVIWTSSDDNIASVDENGLVTTASLGNVTITAKAAAGDASATFQLEVIETLEATKETANSILDEWAPRTAMGIISSEAISAARAAVTEATTIQAVKDAVIDCAKTADGKVVTLRSGNGVNGLYIYLNDNNGAQVYSSGNTTPALNKLWVVGANPTSLDDVNFITLKSYEGNHYWAGPLDASAPYSIATTTTEADAVKIQLVFGKNNAADKDDDFIGLTWEGLGSAGSNMLNFHGGESHLATWDNASNNKFSSGSAWVFEEIVLPEEISFDPATTMVVPGATLTLTPTITPENVTAGWGDLTWATSDDEVATVDNGVVTGVAEGHATITATSALLPSVAATVNVTVAKEHYTVDFDGEATLAMTTVDNDTRVIVSINKAGASEDDETAAYTGEWTATLVKKIDSGTTISVGDKIEKGNGSVTISRLEAGSYTLTINPVDEATTSFSDNTLPITVTAVLSINQITNPSTAIQLKAGESGNAIFTIITNAGSIAPTVDDITVTESGVTVDDSSVTVTPKTDAEGNAIGQYTVTVPFTTQEATTAENPTKITISIAVGDATSSATANISVKPADAPHYNVAFSGDAIVDNKVTIEAGKSAEVTLTFTNKDDGSAATPAVDELIATVDGAEGVTAEITENEGSYTLTVTTTAAATPGDYTIEISADEDAHHFIIETNSLAVAVIAAPVEINGIAITTEPTALKIDLAADETEGSVNVEGMVTPENAVIPAGATVAIEAPETLPAGLTIADIDAAVITDNGTFSAVIKATVGDDFESPEDVTFVATYTSEFTAEFTVTITKAAEQPEEPKEPVIDVTVPTPAEGEENSAPTVDITPDPVTGIQNVTIDFNATPAPAEGETEARPILTVALPSKEGTEIVSTDYTISYQEGEDDETTSSDIVSVSLDDNKVSVTATGSAKIGDIIRIIIRKVNQALNHETQSLALLEEDETPETSDDDIVMIINVTIHGVEFVNAPSTATLSASGTAAVTFENNISVPEDTEVTFTVTDADGNEVSSETAAKTNRVEFTGAGTYTVTLAGGNYIAAKTISIKNAPTVTGIEAVNADAASGNATVYDLSGRRLTRVTTAGIYIVNGEKTLVR